MGRYYPFSYNRRKDGIEIIIYDSDGKIVESFKFHLNNKETPKNIQRILKKYGIDLSSYKRNRDLEWLDTDL